jgi:hypothetical protein
MYMKIYEYNWKLAVQKNRSTTTVITNYSSMILATVVQRNSMYSIYGILVLHCCSIVLVAFSIYLQYKNIRIDHRQIISAPYTSIVTCLVTTVLPYVYCLQEVRIITVIVL